VTSGASAHEIGFKLGRYDHSRELVIDPTLTYATYLGGTGYHIPAGPDCCGASANGIAVDSFGSAYIVGTTGSSDFPVSGTAFQSTNEDADGPGNAFVSKLDPTGATLVYSTYLGGTGDYWFKDAGQAIAVDTSGNAYVTGYTGSSDFPVTAGAFQVANKAAALSGRNAFVTKLSADGSGLIYSTYLGGSGFNTGVARDGDYGEGIAVDSSGNAFIVGSSYSQDFPVTGGAFQTKNKAWPILQTNLFITKLNASGTSLSYSTYLGGTGVSQNCCYYFSGADYGTGIAIDTLGDAYVTGYAHSKDFPVTPGAFQTVNHAHNSINGTGAVDTNPIVTKLNSRGTALLYSTYVGGSGNPYRGDVATGIAIDPGGYAYITGEAGSSDFPTTSGAFQTLDTMPGYEYSGFVTKLNLLGSGLMYSTYLSGTGQRHGSGDVAAGIAVDANSQAYVVGTVVSSDFPVTPDAFQKVNNETIYQSADYYSGNAFITQFNASGSGLVYSSYFGGSGAADGSGGDIGLAIALDSAANGYICGDTLSTDLPVTEGAFQIVNKANAAGNPDSATGFVAQFGIGSGLPLVPTATRLTASVNPQTAGGLVTFTASVTDLVDTIPSGNVTFKVDGTQASIVALNSSGQAAYATKTLSTGVHKITAAYFGTTVFAPSSAMLTETINSNTVQLIFQTSPVGLAYLVDGTTYTSAQALTLAIGSTHKIAVSSPQINAGTQHIFATWSDGGAQSHLITVPPTSTTYTANFKTAYLLTTATSPTFSGTVAPASGSYYPSGSVVNLTATPNSGYAFNNWVGDVAHSGSGSTTIAMTAPQSVTAYFVVSGTTLLFGNITGKSGPSNARVWSIQVSNNGPAAAVGAQVSNIALAQVGGTACTPTATTALPATAGNLAPGASATVPLTINFSGCEASARFTAVVNLSANAGNSGGSIVRRNQFQ
jgi:hypothetical protein